MHVTLYYELTQLAKSTLQEAMASSFTKNASNRHSALKFSRVLIIKTHVKALEPHGNHRIFFGVIYSLNSEHFFPFYYACHMKSVKYFHKFCLAVLAK